MKKYLASLDMTAKVITFVVSLMPLVPAVQYYYIRSVSLLIIAIILFAVIIITYLYKPLYYTIDTEGVHIKKLFSEQVISLTELQKAERKNKKELTAGIRLFGSGGYLGYLGLYSYGGNIGKVSMQCTNRNNMILLTTTKKKIIISPDDPDEFLEMLNMVRLSK